MRGLTLVKTLPYILLIGGLVGIFCSATLTLEKISVLSHPNTHLNCDINPIVACGPVINTKQASAFGFPNPFLGLIGFSAVATIGAALLAGAKFRRWFWLGLQAGTTFSVLFVTWLQYETIFEIHALCPYCMVTWAVTIPIFWYTTLYNLSQGRIRISAVFKGLAKFVQKHHGDILAVWFLIIIGVILNRFWYYWKILI